MPRTNQIASVLDGIYVSHQGDSGERVVLIHGGAQGSSSAGHKNFHAQEPLASQGWQLIIPDRPGHGESPNPGRPDDAEQDAVWTAELLGDGAHLVGHSFGGLVALAAAAIRPEAVKSLVLIEPALHKLSTSAPAVRSMLFRMAATMILPYAPATKARRVMGLLGIPDSFGRTEEELTVLGKALGKSRLPARDAMAAWVRNIRNHNIPLLVISSGSNKAFNAVCEITAKLGGGRHITIPAEHHFPQWAGAPFNDALVKFWSGLSPRVASAGL